MFTILSVREEKIPFWTFFFGLAIVTRQSRNNKKDTFVLLDSEIANGSSITMIIQLKRRSNSMLLGRNSAGRIVDTPL